MKSLRAYKVDFNIVTLGILLSYLTVFSSAQAQLVTAGRGAVSAISALVKSANALPDAEIVRLSELARETAGTARVGRQLGELQLADDVLEDAFMRIAIQQNKLDRGEAEEIHSRLAGVSGFRTTLRKITGNNVNGTAGHLNELRIANSASKAGYKVIAIGDSFDDRLKRAPTDIDVILEMGGKTIVIEAKSYLPSTPLPMDSFRADLNTLMVYKKYKAENGAENVLTVFSLSNAPDQPSYLRLLELEANLRDVQLVIGNPDQIIAQVTELTRIMFRDQ